jgi:hypothetical protein
MAELKALGEVRQATFGPLLAQTRPQRMSAVTSAPGTEADSICSI